MDLMTTLAIGSIVASLTSMIVAVIAIGLSFSFFVKGRNTETAVSNLLVEIRTQVQVLQQITAGQMDRLIKHVTKRRPQSTDKTLPQLIALSAQLLNQLAATLSQTPQTDDREALLNDLTSCSILLYFYTAEANYWARLSLAKTDEFEAQDSFLTLIRTIIDMSASDFNIVARALEKQDLTRLKEGTPAHQFLHETAGFFNTEVRTSSQELVERAHIEKKA